MDMQKLMQQAQQMQVQMEAAQAKLATEKVEASAGGGMVTVTATGSGEITAIEIDPEAVDPSDVELLQDMVLAAVNEAHRMAGDLANQRLGSIMPGGMGGMGLPGF
jgi:DNA-binding YbaB/EbfC family protein